MGRGSAREINFISLVAYGPKVSDSALAMGVTASETRQGGSQHHPNELVSKSPACCQVAPRSTQRKLRMNELKRHLPQPNPLGSIVLLEATVTF